MRDSSKACPCGNHDILQVWRGEHYACSHSEYLQVKRQLMAEMHGGPAAAAADGESTGPRSWAELSSEEQGTRLKERLKKYTQKVGMHWLLRSNASHNFARTHDVGANGLGYTCCITASYCFEAAMHAACWQPREAATAVSAQAC